MNNDRTVSISYGLREMRGQRRLVHLEAIRMRNSAEDYVVHSLTFSSDGPLFKVPNADAAMRTLLMCPPTFDTTAEMPAWGTVYPDALEIVCIEEVLDVRVVDVPRPLVFVEVVSTTPGAHALCEMLTGRALTPDHSWAVRVVQVPEGESLESLTQKCEGKSVFFGPLVRRVKLHCHFVHPDGPGTVAILTAAADIN